MLKPWNKMVNVRKLTCNLWVLDLDVVTICSRLTLNKAWYTYRYEYTFAVIAIITLIFIFSVNQTLYSLLNRNPFCVPIHTFWTCVNKFLVCCLTKVTHGGVFNNQPIALLHAVFQTANVYSVMKLKSQVSYSFVHCLPGRLVVSFWALSPFNVGL